MFIPLSDGSLIVPTGQIQNGKWAPVNISNNSSVQDKLTKYSWKKLSSNHRYHGTSIKQGTGTPLITMTKCGLSQYFPKLSYDSKITQIRWKLVFWQWTWALLSSTTLVSVQGSEGEGGGTCSPSHSLAKWPSMHLNTLICIGLIKNTHFLHRLLNLITFIAFKLSVFRIF